MTWFSLFKDWSTSLRVLLKRILLFALWPSFIVPSLLDQLCLVTRLRRFVYCLLLVWFNLPLCLLLLGCLSDCCWTNLDIVSISFHYPGTDHSCLGSTGFFHICLLSFLKVCLMHFAINKKKHIFFFVLVNEN